MTFLAELIEKLQAVSGHAELDVAPGELLEALRGLDDDAVIELVHEAAEIGSCVERLKVVGAAVIAERSAAPHGGLSGRRGFRTPVQLVQDITGGTRHEASRTMRVGSSLLDDVPAEGEEVRPGGEEVPPGGGVPPGGEGPPVQLEEPVFIWHAELREAMLAGTLSTAAHDAIRRGLGEPAAADRADEVWALAARQLMEEVRGIAVEELGSRARAVRDALDPIGAEERFAQRFANRSWRRWTDEHGVRHAHIVYDDEMGAWVDALMDAALRPRRGGPRFMTDAERAQAESLEGDPRTNDQLTYDLMVDVIRAGALASAEDVFGSRQPGVRMVVVKDIVGPRDPFGRLLATAHLEDGGDALPGSVLEAKLCDTGSREITVDSCGNPLDLGREKRLFTSSQRLAFAIRDGGCMWPGCERPPLFCEAHHCTPWAEGGATDVDAGILLCRFHHLLLHNGGWRITREGFDTGPELGPFILHSPTGEKIVLKSKSPLRWAWNPPPDRCGWRSPPVPATERRPEQWPEAVSEPPTGQVCVPVLVE
ncbi:HNH endonuclease signature motif containing protein [Microbacterium invictum]|uniref:HNH nuclease domain-containing protein n=1 Tax=Microbacterium invictum TaxID=515415 RepID=A0AA40SLP4_9MICO|nr:HNH endonuclease signature motif containing protein [Microbacterium invictum]MBB4138414.1 hypothetical protein [Microbacterium invictum]